MILFIIGLLVMYFLSNAMCTLYFTQTADQQNRTPFPLSTNQQGGGCWCCLYFLYLLRDG